MFVSFVNLYLGSLLNFPEKRRKLVILLFFVMLIPTFSFILINITNFDLSFESLIFDFLLYSGNILFALGICYPLVNINNYYGVFKEKYGTNSIYVFSYDIILKWIFYLIPGFMLLSLSLMDYNLFSILEVFFIVIMPAILLYVQKDVFMDSVLEDKGLKNVGYFPAFYHLPVLLIGIYGYHYGFKFLSQVFTLNTSLCFCALCWIFIVFLFQVIFMLPNEISNLVPFDLKEMKFYLLFLGLWGSLFLFFICTMQPILLSTNPPILSILAWIFRWIFSIIFLIVIFYIIRHQIQPK